MTEIDIWYEGQLSTRCVHRENGQEIRTDAPKDNQGKGEMFSPTDLFAASLGSCVLTVMGILAERIGVDITGTKISVTKEMASAPSRRIGKLTLVLTSPHRFDPDITQRLEKAATGCPVHHSLHPDVIQEYTFNWGQA
jgi:putative redox protein